MDIQQKSRGFPIWIPKRDTKNVLTYTYVYIIICMNRAAELFNAFAEMQDRYDILGQEVSGRIAGLIKTKDEKKEPCRQIFCAETG